MAALLPQPGDYPRPLAAALAGIAAFAAAAAIAALVSQSRTGQALDPVVVIALLGLLLSGLLGIASVAAARASYAGLGLGRALLVVTGPALVSLLIIAPQGLRDSLRMLVEMLPEPADHVGLAVGALAFLLGLILLGAGALFGVVALLWSAVYWVALLRKQSHR